MGFQAGVSILPFRLAFQFGNQHWHFNLAVQLDIWNWHYQLALQIGISIWHFLRPLKTSRVTQNRLNQCFKTSSDIGSDLRPPSAFLRSNFRRSSDFCGDLKQPRFFSAISELLVTKSVCWQLRSPGRQGNFLTPQQFLANSDRQGIFLTLLVGELLPHGGGTGQHILVEPLNCETWAHSFNRK